MSMQPEMYGLWTYSNSRWKNTGKSGRKKAEKEEKGGERKERRRERKKRGRKRERFGLFIYLMVYQILMGYFILKFAKFLNVRLES